MGITSPGYCPKAASVGSTLCRRPGGLTPIQSHLLRPSVVLVTLQPAAWLTVTVAHRPIVVPGSQYDLPVHVAVAAVCSSALAAVAWLAKPYLAKRASAYVRVVVDTLQLDPFLG